MDKKKILISATAVICVVGVLLFNTLNKKADDSLTNKEIYKHQAVTPANNNDRNTIESKSADNKTDKKTLKTGIEQVKNISAEEHADKVIHANLYEDASSELPLSAITVISVLPKNVQTVVTDISKNNNIYMIQKNKDKLLIISDNPENIRHNIAFTEVNISNGHQVKTTLGYNDKMNDSKNDIWEYNKETAQPLRHTKYNSEGDVDFVEEWNYDTDNPVKYEMKDGNGKVISMRKETLNDGTDLRIEHLVYDKEGNTKINVTTTYEGEDIKRFTYYNADKSTEGGAVFSDYANGQKIKETVYTSDLKVKNTYTSEYKDGNRENITVFDNKNQEINKYIQHNEN